MKPLIKLPFQPNLLNSLNRGGKKTSLILPILCLLLTSARAQLPYADFVNSPVSSIVEFDEVFSVTIRVDINGDPVSVAELHLDFDPSVLEVVSLTPAAVGTGQPLELVIVPPAFNNTAGTIDYGAFRLFPPFPTASFDLLTITFRAIATTSGTQVTHDLVNFPTSLIAYAGQNVLDVANPINIIVECQGDAGAGDTDGDGLCDDVDTDDDNDGCPDAVDPNPLVASVDSDNDTYGADCDCNDTDPAINPGATEICDGIDNDCDGLIDAEDPSLDGQSAPAFDCNLLSDINLATEPLTCDNGTDIIPPVAADDCGGAVTATGTRSDNLPLNDPWPLGSTVITWTFTDPVGLQAFCTQTVIVTDGTPPIAVCQNISIDLDAGGNASITEAQIDGGSSDACSISSLSLDINTFDCTDVTSAAVPTDLFISEYIEGSSNNKAVEIFNGTGATVDLSGYELFISRNGGSSTSTFPLSGNLLDGDVYVMVNDAANSAILAVADFQSSTINFNGDDAVVLRLAGGGAEVDIIGRIGEDPGSEWTGGGLSTVDRTLRRKNTVTSGITANPAAGFPTLTTEWDGYSTDDSSDLGAHSLAGPGGVTVTLTVTDGNSNSSTCTAVVTVNDVTPPLTPTIADATGECSVTVTAPTTTDACAGTVTGTTTDPLTYTAQGTYTINWTFDDGNGNTAAQTQIVTVDDVTAPVPDLASLPALTGECSVTVSTAPTATDNCVGTVTATTTDPLTYTAQGTYTINWTFDDGNGNTAGQTQSVTVQDVTPPQITCAAGDSRNTDPGVCTYTISGAEFDPVSVSDNCGVASVTHNYNGGGTTLNGQVLPYGPTTITWTITDVNGLSNTCTVEITIVPQDNDGDGVACDLDCDDDDPNNFPGNLEIYDGQDNDCDGLVDGDDPDVGGQTLNGNVTIAAACNTRIITVRVYDQGTSNLVYTLTAPVDGAGNFSVTGIAPGNYDIFVKSGGFLQKGLYGQTIAAGATNLIFGAMLPGDVVDDNAVDGVDLSALIAAYNTVSGNPQYNPNADFNCDGVVDGIDLSALIANYNTVGDLPTP